MTGNDGIVYRFRLGIGSCCSVIATKMQITGVVGWNADAISGVVRYNPIIYNSWFPNIPVNPCIPQKTLLKISSLQRSNIVFAQLTNKAITGIWFKAGNRNPSTIMPATKSTGKAHASRNNEKMSGFTPFPCAKYFIRIPELGKDKNVVTKTIRWRRVCLFHYHPNPVHQMHT